MSLSQLLSSNKDQVASGRFRLKPSWKIAAFVGVPALIAGFAGLSYYLYKRKNSSSGTVDAESLPKTPLEAALALKNKGNKYFKGGQYAKAIELYTQGLELCPVKAAVERAALFQNRAAARENQRQYEPAAFDCSEALELSPRYLKALNRRARLYEKLEDWEHCLPDVVACCILEEFKNPDNILCMDQTLKRVGQKKAQEEWKALSHTLPSDAFIRNYFSAFASNPFLPATKVPKPKVLPADSTNGINGSTVDDGEASTHPEQSPDSPVNHTSDSATVAVDSSTDRFVAAETVLNKALKQLTNEDYISSMDTAAIAVELFDKAFAVPTDLTKKLVKTSADGDEEATVTSSTANADNGGEHKKPSSPDDENEEASQAKNGHDGTGEKPTEIEHPAPSSTELPSPGSPEAKLEPSAADLEHRFKAAHCQAILLHGTYLALCGRAAEAKRCFQRVASDKSGAEPAVRVNALIKSACLSMSVDQDFAACLYEFQTAQNSCPECPDVYLHRGQINLLADQLDEALHDLNTAVKLKPEFSIAQAQRLYTLYRKAISDGNPERAAGRVSEFRRLATKFSNCLETHSLFAQVLTERGDFTAADEEFGRVIELAPNSGLAYAHRALLQLRWKQDRDAAYKWLTMGAKADPKCELILELLGQLAVEQGDFQTALAHFNQAISQAKTQNDLAHLIALREGVMAQFNVCTKYGIAVSDVVASLQRQQQQMMRM